MATPSPKSPALEHFLNDLFGRSSAIEADVCVFCAQDASVFRDEASRVEYTMSGLCQDCQDEVFTDEDC